MGEENIAGGKRLSFLLARWHPRHTAEAQDKISPTKESLRILPLGVGMGGVRLIFVIFGIFVWIGDIF